MARTAQRTIIAGLMLTLFSMHSALALTPEESARWRADIDAYEKTLEERHIDLHNRISREAFARELAALRADLDELREEEVVVALMALTRKVGDGHTTVPLWGTPYKRFPFEITLLDGEPIVTGASAEHAALLGARLTSINGAPASEIIRAISKIAPFIENDQSKAARTGMYLLVSELLTGIGVTEGDGPFDLAFDKDGERIAVASTPIGKAAFAEAIVHRLDYRGTDMAAPIYKVNDQVWASAENSGQSIYIRFDAYPSDEEIEEMGAVLLDYIDERSSRNLIIDLRENFGGDFYKGLRLASHLNLADSIDWMNGVYVLTGRKTFSAAMSNAAQYRRLLNARLVGEPTGGRPCGYQDMGQFNLPNSGLLITYSKRRFCFEAGKAVKPDISVPLTKADYLAGRDGALGAVFADIESRK